MPIDREEFLKSLEDVAERIGPGWQQALHDALKAYAVRPHDAEMRLFVEQVRAIEPMPPAGDQLDFGGTTLVLDGSTAAQAFVSSGSVDHKIWIEDWVIRNQSGFLDMRPAPGKQCELKFSGGYGAGPDAALVALTSHGMKAWRSTQVGSYIPATSIPPAPSITVTEFALKQGGVERGHLFREVYSQKGETWVDDHWVLRANYAPPAPGASVAIVYISSTANLTTRLAELKTEAITGGTTAPKSFIFMSARLREYPPI